MKPKIVKLIQSKCNVKNRKAIKALQNKIGYNRTFNAICNYNKKHKYKLSNDLERWYKYLRGKK